MGRLIFFGIDGLSHSMWLDLCATGVMPRSAELLAETSAVPMQSSVPEVSSVAWTSIVTGSNSGQHNIFGFTDIIDGTYALAFTSARTVKATPFWQLPAAGHSLVMNIPQTYPAQPLNGTLAAGYVALDLAKAVYPSEILPVFAAAGYEIDVSMDVARISEERFHDELRRVLRTRAGMLEQLWEAEDWDSIAFVITGTDRLNHYFWNRYEEGDSPERDRFLGFYGEVDAVLGSVLDRINDDDALVIVSDHGFARQEWSVNVNQVLKEAGFLVLESGQCVTPASMLPATRAFALDPGRIYLHHQGRYPRGTVTEGEVEGVLAELEELFGLYEAAGQRVTGSMHRGTDLYHGPWAHRAPDLVLMPATHVAFSARLQSERVVVESQIRGKHTREDAVFLYRGCGDVTIPEPMTVFDVLPTLRHVGAFGKETE